MYRRKLRVNNLGPELLTFLFEDKWILRYTKKSEKFRSEKSENANNRKCLFLNFCAQSTI